jgi:hypothetical protein
MDIARTLAVLTTAASTVPPVAVTFTSRALLASASIALASFSISPAFAQQHVLVQSFDPLTEERGVSIGRDEPSRHTFFGSDVAIRNGLAFIGMSNASSRSNCYRTIIASVSRLQCSTSVSR